MGNKVIRGYAIKKPDGEIISRFFESERSCIIDFLQRENADGQTWYKYRAQGYECIRVQLRKLSIEERLRQARLARMNKENPTKNNNGSTHLS